MNTRRKRGATPRACEGEGVKGNVCARGGGSVRSTNNERVKGRWVSRGVDPVTCLPLRGRALPLANPICYRLIGQITYYYRRFISHISPRLRPLVTSPLITVRRRVHASSRHFERRARVCGLSCLKGFSRFSFNLRARNAICCCWLRAIYP